MAQKVGEIHDGKELSSQLKHACTAHGFERVFLSRVHDFIHIDLRQCVVCASAADDQGWNDRQCEREANNDAGALAQSAVKFHMATEFLDVGFHHIHADAST